VAGDLTGATVRAEAVTELLGDDVAPVPVPDRLKHLPRAILTLLREQSEGDWRRVTLDADGSVVIHNQPQTFRTELPPVRRPAKKLRPVPKALREHIGVEKPAPVEREVLVMPDASPVIPVERTLPPPEVPKKERVPKTEVPRFKRPTFDRIVLPGINGEKDWVGADLESTFYELSRQLQGGLPDSAGLGFHGDVLSLDGIDLKMVEDVVRRPARVEIAPEGYRKGHGILRFHRGDVCVAVGFRDPHRPLIIAAYVTAEAMNQYLKFSDAGVGGGGNKEKGGLPTNPGALVKRLRSLGATVVYSEDQKTATIKYEGEDFGKVNTSGIYTKQGVASDWNRMQRKINARARRVVKS
jgi:hypothetical protein